MNRDLTIVYYTHNREKPAFEKMIQRTLRHNSKGLPIVSVSHKPMDFGTNICVGELFLCGHNALRQLLIGCKAAKTRFVCPAESDYLKPKEFFEFVPKRDDIFYMAMPLYICFAQGGARTLFAPKPRGSEANMITNREYLIEKMEKMFEGRPTWETTDDRNERTRLPYLFRLAKVEIFYTVTPTVTFKTDNNMHRKTPHDPNAKTAELLGWGNAKELRKRYGP